MLPSRPKSRDVTRTPPTPRLSSHHDLVTKGESGKRENNPLELEDFNRQFDVPLGTETSNSLRSRNGSSSSLPKRRRAAKKAGLGGGSLHSKLMDQQKQYQPMRNAEFSNQQSGSPHLRRRGQKKDILDNIGANSTHVQQKSRRSAASQSHSTHRRRRRRSRHSASPLHATMLGCVGSNLFEGINSDDSSDSIDDVSSNDDDDEEYGSQDSPSMSFPSSPLMGSFVRKTSTTDRSYPETGNLSLKSGGSKITAISDLFLNSAATTEIGGEALYEGRKTCRRKCKRKENHSYRMGREARIIQFLLLALFLCAAFIANGIIMQPVQTVDKASCSGVRSDSSEREDFNADAEVVSNKDPNFEVYHIYEEQLNDLQSQVDSLQITMQQLAARQLADAYFDGKLPSDEVTMDVKLDLGGLFTGHSFVVQVSHSQMPYATWVFLKELSKGEWILRSNDQWLEVVPAPSHEKQNRHIRQSLSPSNTGRSKNLQNYESFDHLENSINVDRTFVVGMRNPKEGEAGVVISIYKERGMCGNYENEVCFGKIGDGFDSLNAVTELGKIIPINGISTRT